MAINWPVGSTPVWGNIEAPNVLPPRGLVEPGGGADADNVSKYFADQYQRCNMNENTMWAVMKALRAYRDQLK
jgi:hypothetical protein